MDEKFQGGHGKLEIHVVNFKKILFFSGKAIFYSFLNKFILQEYGMQHGFTFRALAAQAPGTKAISVGDVGSPGHQHRSQIVQGANAGKDFCCFYCF